MRAYWSAGKLRFVGGLQYRSAAFAGMATQFFWGFMYIMIFVAFYSHSSRAGTPSMTLGELISYIWLQQAFLAFIALWFRDNEIFQLITSGNIAYELCRPCGLYEYWYVKLLATRLSSALLRCFPIVLVAAFLPEPYRIGPPPSAASLFLFMASLFIGLLVLVAISMFIYISVFWTMSPVGSLLIFGVLGEFMAGLVIPIPFMPGWLQNIVYALPFRWTADFPFRVYSGHIPAGEALRGLGIQAAWLFALVLIGKRIMTKALRNVVIQGG
ncbi:ABC transporter permease [Cohnella sp. CFH 77786]|uniref:ABC transporter permease n=1 Tax=Cohnella sp. CFH 77786 TaxID=2662265 RepID=UPI001C60DED2|nr:ABC transporter permease [Cohnella sp. CFH 77786]MBW5446327.1 ABC transporter permease [Cohnella sp. CFH 77786]